MGKQLAFVMTKDDENNFISYLETISDFILIEGFAKTPEQVFVKQFDEEFAHHISYSIWNRQFSWQYEILATNTKEKRFYVSSIGAPFVEFLRCWSTPKPGYSYGRIFVDTYPKDNLPYNQNELIIWYEQLAKWIRKNAAGKVKNAWTTYYLPSAWQEHNNTIV